MNYTCADCKHDFEHPTVRWILAMGKSGKRDRICTPCYELRLSGVQKSKEEILPDSKLGVLGDKPTPSSKKSKPKKWKNISRKKYGYSKDKESDSGNTEDDNRG